MSCLVPHANLANASLPWNYLYTLNFEAHLLWRSCQSATKLENKMGDHWMENMLWDLLLLVLVLVSLVLVLVSVAYLNILLEASKVKNKTRNSNYM